jgi:hypothetical protein
MDEAFLFYAAILMEIPIAMVLLSAITKPKLNAWLNVFSGAIKTLAMLATFFVGTATSYYLFFACIEIATTVYIVYYAVRWLQQLKMNRVELA